MAKKMTGPEKAAVLLLGLGEDMASQVMQAMEVKEIRLLSNFMSRVKEIPPETVEQVFKEYTETAKMFPYMAQSGEGYVKSILEKTLGADKAEKMMEQVAGTQTGENSGLESLKWMDALTVSNMIKMEHPQTIALILTYLGINLAGQVFGILPDHIKADVASRLADLGNVPPGMIRELEEALQTELSVSGQAQAPVSLGGVKMVAEILNLVDRATESSVIASIEETNPEMATQIRENMFVFENLITIDDRGIQDILKDVKREDLTLALKGVDDDMKDKFYKNMSERARDTLKDDLETMGPVKLKDVEAAQKEILGVARRLSDEGKIVLGGVGAEELVV